MVWWLISQSWPIASSRSCGTTYGGNLLGELTAWFEGNLKSVLNTGDFRICAESNCLHCSFCRNQPIKSQASLADTYEATRVSSVNQVLGGTSIDRSTRTSLWNAGIFPFWVIHYRSDMIRGMQCPPPPMNCTFKLFGMQLFRGRKICMEITIFNIDLTDTQWKSGATL